MMNDPTHWKNPEDFNPERFIDAATGKFVPDERLVESLELIVIRHEKYGKIICFVGVFPLELVAETAWAKAWPRMSSSCFSQHFFRYVYAYLCNSTKNHRLVFLK